MLIRSATTLFIVLITLSACSSDGGTDRDACDSSKPCAEDYRCVTVNDADDAGTCRKSCTYDGDCGGCLLSEPACYDGVCYCRAL